jgi:hypothetical protein
MAVEGLGYRTLFDGHSREAACPAAKRLSHQAWRYRLLKIVALKTLFSASKGWSSTTTSLMVRV